MNYELTRTAEPIRRRKLAKGEERVYVYAWYPTKHSRGKWHKIGRNAPAIHCTDSVADMPIPAHNGGSFCGGKIPVRKFAGIPAKRVEARQTIRNKCRV